MAHDIRVLGNRFVYLGRKHDYRLTSAGLQKFFFLVHGRHMGLHGTYYNRMAVLLGMIPETEATT
jgi:uncharacterized phage-associated protein